MYICASSGGIEAAIALTMTYKRRRNASLTRHLGRRNGDQDSQGHTCPHKTVLPIIISCQAGYRWFHRQLVLRPKKALDALLGLVGVCVGVTGGGMPIRTSPTLLRKPCSAKRTSVPRSRFRRSTTSGKKVSTCRSKSCCGKLLYPSITSTTTGRQATMLRCCDSSSRTM